MSGQTIGVEVHMHGIRVARVLSSSRGVQVQHAAEARFPDGTTLASLAADPLPEALAAVLDVRQMAGRQTVVVLDHPAVFLSMFDLAAGFTDELKSSIKWYAEQYIPYPVDEAAVDFRVQDSPYAGHKTVFLVALHKSVLAKVVELLPPKRLKLRRVDGVPYALERLYRKLVAGRGEPDEPALLVHASASGGYLVVTCEGRTESLRHVRLGEALVLSLAEKARQTCQHYEVHHPTESVRSVYVTRSTLELDGVGETLSDELGLPVQALGADSAVAFAAGKDSADETGKGWHKYALAIGAAL